MKCVGVCCTGVAHWATASVNVGLGLVVMAISQQPRCFHLLQNNDTIYYPLTHRLKPLSPQKPYHEGRARLEDWRYGARPLHHALRNGSLPGKISKCLPGRSIPARYQYLAGALGFGRHRRILRLHEGGRFRQA